MRDVYKVVPTAPYCGGAALIAATCANDAEIVFKSTDYNVYQFDYGICKVELINGIHSDKNNSEIIFNHIYLE